jgi:hypothetical protein
MTPKLSKSEIETAIKQVADELQEMFKAETLTKSDDFPPKKEESSKSKKEESSSSSSPASPEESKGSESSGSAEVVPEGTGNVDTDPAETPVAPVTAPDERSIPVAPESALAEPPVAEDPSAQGPIDFEDLKGQFMQMAPEDLKMYFLAAKAALDAAMGTAPEAPAPVAPAPVAPTLKAEESMAPKAEESKKEESPKEKKEESSSSSFSSPSLSKAEPSIAEEKLAKATAEIADLKGKVESLIKSMEVHFSTPVRKSITSVPYVVGTEAVAVKPTREVIREKLAEVAVRKQDSLKKSDMDRIVSYELGLLDYEQVKDLIETK